jgi:putative copper export protein
MTLLLGFLAVALTALWLAEVRPYRVAPRRRAAVQTGAAALALSLALDASAAVAAHSSDHYLEVHAPAAWTAASSAFDGWVV